MGKKNKNTKNKNTITEIENSLYRCNSRVDMTKERMHEHEDRTIEITLFEQERKNRVKKEKINRDW